jgi:hypothetical protein
MDHPLRCRRLSESLLSRANSPTGRGCEAVCLCDSSGYHRPGAAERERGSQTGYGSGRSHPPPPLIRPGVGVIRHHGPRSDVCGLREGQQQLPPPAREGVGRGERTRGWRDRPLAVPFGRIPGTQNSHCGGNSCACVVVALLVVQSCQFLLASKLPATIACDFRGGMNGCRRRCGRHRTIADRRPSNPS